MKFDDRMTSYLNAMYILYTTLSKIDGTAAFRGTSVQRFKHICQLFVTQSESLSRPPTLHLSGNDDDVNSLRQLKKMYVCRYAD